MTTHLREFREFWRLFQRLRFCYHESQRNFLLQRNSNVDLHIRAALPLFRQALGTNMTQVSGIRMDTRNLNLKDVHWWYTLTCRSSSAASASCSSICLRLSRARESYILVLQRQKQIRVCLVFYLHIISESII